SSSRRRACAGPRSWSPMPNARPTPGPWEIRHFGYPVAEDGMWVPQIGAEVHPYADVVARVGVLGGRRAPERVVADARYIVACANAVFRLAEHLGRNPLEVAEGLDLVAMVEALEHYRDECWICAGTGENRDAMQAWDIPGAPVPECHACAPARAALAALRGEGNA